MFVGGDAVVDGFDAFVFEEGAAAGAGSAVGEGIVSGDSDDVDGAAGGEFAGEAGFGVAGGVWGDGGDVDAYDFGAVVSDAQGGESMMAFFAVFGAGGVLGEFVEVLLDVVHGCIG